MLDTVPWDRSHPDPKGSTLRLLGRALEVFVKGEWGTPAGTYGVFLDFCSLCQKDANGERTPNEGALFGKALKSLDQLYSHPSTMVMKISALPRRYPKGFTFPTGIEPNKAAYYGRGWCATLPSIPDHGIASPLC